jgi:protein disulfide-isomerase A1
MDEVSPENYEKYIESGLPMAYLFYAGTDMRAKYGKIVEELVAPYKGSLLAVYIDGEKFDGHAKSLALPEVWPGFVIHEPEKDLKYPFDSSKEGLTKEGLAAFLLSYSKDQLKPTFRSESVPENPIEADGVYKVVNKNFEDIILDGKKDVLLMIQASWCGACKRIAPAYVQAAKAYTSHSDKIIFARMDGTENDIPKSADITLTKFPTIILFKAGGKEQIEMERPTDSLDSFVEFIGSHSTHKLEVSASAAGAKYSKDTSGEEDPLSKDEL